MATDTEERNKDEKDCFNNIIKSNNLNKFDRIISSKNFNYGFKEN